MRRVRRLNNIPIILLVVLILIVLAGLTILLGPGGNLLGTTSQLPTPTRELVPPPSATRVRPTVEATATPVPATEVPAATSTPLPPEEPSPTSEPAAEPSPTSAPPTPTVASTGSVRPVVECVTANGDGTYTAYFGYRNDGDEAVTIPVGPRNRIAPAPEDRGQPTTFSPGGTAPWPNAPFSAAFSGGGLSWTVDGQTASASPDSPPCVYRVHIDVKWYDTDGSLLAGPPDSLPPEFAITAQSEIGSATCTYPDGSSLVCQYNNQSGGGGALLVPPDTSYSTGESGLPAGWHPFSGIGLFPGSGGSQSVSHVIDNRAAGAPTPTPSPTPTLASSDIRGSTPAPTRPAAPTVPPAAPPASTGTPLPTETAAAPTPPTGEPPTSRTATPAAVAQVTPSPSVTGTPVSILPSTGRGTDLPLLSFGALGLGLVLMLLGLRAIWRRPD